MEENITRRGFLQFGAALGAELFLPDHVLDCKVFMFHFENGAGVASVISQMEAEGRKNILPSELAKALIEGKNIPPSYALTLDDGYLMQMNILDVLGRMDARACFYVMGNWRGDGVHSYISNDQKREIAGSGVAEIGCHTTNHPKNLPELVELNFGAALEEVAGAKKFLEDLTGKEVVTFAYPYGLTGSGLIKIVSEQYLAAFTTQKGSLHYFSTQFTLPRLSVN